MGMLENSQKYGVWKNLLSSAQKQKLGTLPGFPNSFQTFLSPFPIHPRSWFQGGECVFLITMTASKVESRLPNVSLGPWWGPRLLHGLFRRGLEGMAGLAGGEPRSRVPYCRFNAPSQLMFKDGTPDCKVLDDSPFQRNDVQIRFVCFWRSEFKVKPRPAERLKGWWDRKKNCGPTTKKSQAQKSSSTVRNYICIYIWVICLQCI